MNNMINVGGMMGYYNNYIQAVNRGSDIKKTDSSVQDSNVSSKTGFVSVIDSKVEANYTEGLQKVNHTEVISKKDMTLDEYKKYISEKISSFQFCSDALNDSYSVDISDDGFKAMQNDPEYEKWVLNELKTTFATPYPSWARAIRKNRYCVMHFGATKEECYGMSWGNSFQNGSGSRIWENSSSKSFWVRRSNRDNKSKEIIDEKRRAEKLKEKESIERRLWNNQIKKRNAMVSEMLQKAAISTYERIASNYTI